MPSFIAGGPRTRVLARSLEISSSRVRLGAEARFLLVPARGRGPNRAWWLFRRLLLKACGGAMPAHCASSKARPVWTGWLPC
jgi:hypothetical protein